MFHTCYRYVVFNSRGDNFMEARETVNCLEVFFATPNKKLPAFITKPIFSYVFPAQRNRGQPVIRRHVSRQERHSGHQHSEGSPVLGRVLSAHLLPEEL